MTRMKKIMQYLLCSIIATLVDILLVWLCKNILHFDLVVANTMGVLAGFVVQYLLTSKQVFDSKYGLTGLMIYLGTFLFGLVLANGIITYCYQRLFSHYSDHLNLLLSKGMSIILPFFILYEIRRQLYKAYNNRIERKKRESHEV